MKLLGQRLLVKRVQTEEKTDSGIYIPNTVRDSKQLMEVVQVSEHLMTDIKAGNKVMVNEHISGYDVGDGLMIINESEVLAVM